MGYLWPVLLQKVCQNVLKCDRTLHTQKRAACTHIAHTFQDTFCTHIAHMRVCVCGFNFATHSLSIMEALLDAMSDLHWEFEQSEDPQCKVMKAWIKKQKLSLSSYMQTIITLYGSRSFIDSDNGLLYIYSGKTRRLPNKRLWVPERLKTMIMANHHGSTLGGHWREAKTYEAISIKYFLPSMAQDIESHIKLCKICHQQDNRDNSKNKAPLQPWGPPKARNEKIHFDLVGQMHSLDG